MIPAISQNDPAAGSSPSTRRFRIVDRHDELRQALEFPWERWIVFLHPSQRQIVDKNLKGPGAVSGSAGTGKSVLGLHRAASLANRDNQATVLLRSEERRVG